MRQRSSLSWWRACALGGAGCLTLAGCGANPAGVSIPAYQPAKASQWAMELFDTNKNGTIEAAELVASPGLQAALPRIDTNGDGQLSAEEISARLTSYSAQPIAVMPLVATITRNGQPVKNAKVTFVPEPFLKEAIQPATGITDGTGKVSLQKEGLGFPALQLGLYRVEVSQAKDGGNEPLPKQFNTETTLGAEVAPDVPNLERGLPIVLK